MTPPSSLASSRKMYSTVSVLGKMIIGNSPKNRLVNMVAPSVTGLPIKVPGFASPLHNGFAFIENGCSLIGCGICPVGHD